MTAVDSSVDSSTNLSVPDVPATESPAFAAAPAPVRRGHRKSPFLACALSLMPGVGQVYVGYYKLGFTHNLIFASTVFIISLFENEALVPLFAIFLAFFFIYNVVDAGRRASLYNLALDGAEGIELPQEMDLPLPALRGSRAGGLVLMVLGGLLLSNTAFGLSLAWIESWWPVAPMGLGAYLFVKAWHEPTPGAPTPPVAPPSDPLSRDA